MLATFLRHMFSLFLPLAYRVREKVIFILGNVCLFTTVAFLLLAHNCGPFAARSAGGMPLAVSCRRTFLCNK